MDTKSYAVAELRAKEAAALSLAEISDRMARMEARIDSILDLVGHWSPSADDGDEIPPGPGWDDYAPHVGERSAQSPLTVDSPPTRGRGRPRKDKDLTDASMGSQE